MRRRALPVLIGSLAALGLGSLPLGAQAVPVVYTIADGGVDNGFICAELSGACTSSQTDYTYSGPVDLASGTITLDSSAGTVAYAISVAGPIDFSNGGGNQVDFTGMSYAGTVTGANFTAQPGGTAITWLAQVPSGSAVSGTTAETPGGGGGAFGPLAARMSGGQCFLTTAGELTCGFIFGPGSFSTSIFGTTHRIVHVMNVTAPEPSTIGLLLMGLAGIAFVARRQL